MTTTLTKAALMHHLEEQIGLDDKHALAMVEYFFEEIMLALENNEIVKLTGLGCFALRKKKTRLGRNPKTGASIPVSARRVVSFQASASLKKQLLSDPFGA